MFLATRSKKSELDHKLDLISDVVQKQSYQRMLLNNILTKFFYASLILERIWLEICSPRIFGATCQQKQDSVRVLLAFYMSHFVRIWITLTLIR